MAYFRVLGKFGVFSGRAKRSEFWLFILFHNLITIALVALVAILITLVGIDALGLIALIPLYGLIMVVPSLAVGSRRLHDTGRTGWYQLIFIIPIFIGIIPIIGWIITAVCWIIMIVLFALPSQDDNKYGARPE